MLPRTNPVENLLEYCLVSPLNKHKKAGVEKYDLKNLLCKAKSDTQHTQLRCVNGCVNGSASWRR